MVPKKQRVTRVLFDKVFKEGKIHTAKYVYVRALVDATLTLPHYAVVVPKKVLKDASKRNTLKRKVYAILKEQKLPEGIFIFFLKKGADTVSFDDVTKEVNALIYDF